MRQYWFMLVIIGLPPLLFFYTGWHIAQHHEPVDRIYDVILMLLSFIALTGCMVLSIKAVRTLSALKNTISNKMQDFGLYDFTEKYDYYNSLKIINNCFFELLSRVESAEKDNLESENIFNSIVSLQCELVCVININQYLKFSNQSFLKYYGQKNAEDKITTAFHDSISGLGEGIEDLFHQFFTQKISKPYYPIHFTSSVELDKKKCIIAWTIIELKSDLDTKDVDFLFVGRDITELKAVEIKLKRSESFANVGRAVSAISHEVNQPLTVVKVLISHLKDMGYKDQQEELVVKKIETQLQRMGSIINDMKLFNQFGQNVMFEKSEFNLVASINNVVEEQQLILEGQSINIHASLYCKNIMLLGNAIYFEHALHNLVTNSIYAITHMEHKQTEHMIYIECSRSNKNIIIEIRDTGPGVDERIIDKISTPFYSTKPPGKGSGFGLSFCCLVVESMNGELLLENIKPCNDQRHGGLAVKLYLPIQKKPNEFLGTSKNS